ncbi:MAG: helix-turn-helix transcriptional regulator [Armatimonadota bacterium]|nr:MAG: helix-turn-helix transcriptional regulator [Armatimonadota bacterium]
MRSVRDRRPSVGLVVEDLGLQWEHDSAFSVERPHGMAVHLFVRFHSPMKARTTAGVVTSGPGDCLLYDPTFPQWYRGAEGGFADDWVHVGGPRMPELIRLYQIPVNEILRPRETEFVTPIFEAVNRELRRREPHWRESVSLLLESLFLQLARQLPGQRSTELTPAEAARVDGFRSIRMQVHDQMQKSWRVADMARLANLSPSRFAVLYLKLLGTSPMEDLIHARLNRARALLTDERLSVRQVADRTGFGSVCHFARLFRKHVGCAPRDCRRRPLASGLDISEVRDEGNDTRVPGQHSGGTGERIPT